MKIPVNQLLSVNELLILNKLLPLFPPFGEFKIFDCLAEFEKQIDNKEYLKYIDTIKIPSTYERITSFLTEQGFATYKTLEIILLTDSGRKLVKRGSYKSYNRIETIVEVKNWIEPLGIIAAIIISLIALFK